MPDRAIWMLAILLVAACAQRTDDPDHGDLPGPAELVLAPNDPASPVGAETSEAELRDRYGAGNVRRAAVDVGEGHTEPGTVLFPDDPLRRAEILWHDPDSRTRPQRVRIRGAESLWSIAPGIALNVALDSLEQINQGRFVLTGFGWDYEGTVVDWDGGTLGQIETPDASLLIRLAPGPGVDLTEDVMRQIGGEGPFPSDHPVMQRLNPVVYDMGIRFEADDEVRVDGGVALKLPKLDTFRRAH